MILPGLVTPLAALGGSGAGGLLLPTLIGNTIGANAGAAVNADATGFCLLFDTDASSSIPALISGSWTSVITATMANISMRVSWKQVTSGESIDPVGGSRARLRIYSNVDPTTPIHDAQGGGGNGNNANVPALTYSIPCLTIGAIRRGGSGVPTWAAPLDQNVAAQNTTAVLTTAESAGVLGSYAGQAVAIGSNNDWVAVAIALKGAPA